MKTVITPLRAFALSGTLALGAVLLGASNQASATIYRAMSGGAACKPAYSASNKFIFNTLYAENIGTTDQYLVCNVVMADTSLINPSVPELLAVTFTAGAAGGTAVCLVQNGYYFGGTVLSSAVAGSVTIAAGSNGYINWDESLLVRNDAIHVLTLNCKVPGSWRLGYIDYRTAS